MLSNGTGSKREITPSSRCVGSSRSRRPRSAEAQALILGNLSVGGDLLPDAAQGPLVWKVIAHQMGPQALRMNLNTLCAT